MVLAGKTAADIDLDSVQYIFNKPDCKGSEGTETHTVREWLESFGIPVKDEFFRREGEPYIFDAIEEKGRKVPLKEYLAYGIDRVSYGEEFELLNAVMENVL